MGRAFAPREYRPDSETVLEPAPVKVPAPPPSASHVAIVQAKLDVGPANDSYEREADDIAGQIVAALRSGRPAATEVARGADTTAVHRVRRSESIGTAGGQLDAGTEQAVRSARGGGRALADGTRSVMESAFGVDFGRVRVHDGPQAAQLNDRIQAKAFTVGSDIFFRDGTPDAASTGGQELLAHELTHTIQQGGAVNRTVDASPKAKIQRSPLAAERIQRILPTRKNVTDAVGEPKDNTRKVSLGRGGFSMVEKEQATNYKPVLDAIGTADAYIRATNIGADADTIETQLAHALRLYDAVWVAAKEYVEAKGGKRKASAQRKAEYMRGLMRMVTRERVVLESVARETIRNPLAFVATWYGVLTTNANLNRGSEDTPLAAPAAVDLDENNAGAVHGGGINQVTEFDQSGVDSFFKPEKAAITDPTALPDTASQAEVQAAAKEFYIAEDFGIDATDPQLAKRDIAMARLDSLLGANVIARAELAVRNGAQGQPSGSMLDAAGGPGMVRAGDATMAEGNAQVGEIDLQGAGIQRMLSRLQLIDIIAMQADRHMGNYYFEVDATGAVVGITGIDNDLSFGTRTQTTGRQEFPGISRYVDEELAEKVIALHSDDLRWALTDLLKPAEVNAAVTRLTALQDLLRQLKADGRLLKPNQWTAVTAANLWDEASSYHQTVTKEYRKTQQVAGAHQGAHN